MSVKKISKQKQISKQKHKLDGLWSQAIRKRDKRCLLCGNTETLQAHHYAISRARSLAHRHDIKNGITLCYACHLHKVHTDATTHWAVQIKEAVISNKIATSKEITNIENNRSISKLSLEDLLAREEELKRYLNDLP